MKSERPSPGLDLITPVLEIIQEMACLMGKAIYEFGKWLLDRFVGGGGSPNFLSVKALRTKRTTTEASALGIDASTKRVVKLSEIDFRRHSLVVGGSGFGKTNLLSILQENSLSLGRPIIFIDPKGDLETLNSFRDLCRSYGRKCYIFSEYHPDSISLNPLLEGTINQVVSRLMSSFEWVNEYYRAQCEQALFRVLRKLETAGTAFSLSSILEELRLIETEEISGIVTNLTRIHESDFARRLESDTDALTISRIRAEQACLYVGLSVQGYGETARTIGRLILGELLFNSYMTLRTSSQGEGLNNPLSVNFDELGALLVPDFIELLNKCRGAGIELTMAVQSPADFAKFDPNLPTQIVENAANLFILKQRVDDSASFFSKAIGTKLSTKSTHVVEDGETQARGSVREVYELLAHPDIIKNLGIGQCVLLQQGPSRLRLINIRNKAKYAQPETRVQYDPAIF